MSPGQVALFPDALRTLAGERLGVTSALGNDGDAPLTVAGPEGASPYRYKLSGEDGAELMQLSARNAALLVDPDAPALAVDFSHSLPPGEAVSRREELGRMVPGALPPGRYQLVAEYRDEEGTVLRSAPCSVEVAAPRIERLHSELCPFRETLCSVMAARDVWGRLHVLQRESLAGAPRFGVFERRRSLPSPAHVSSVCGCVDAFEIRAGRWLGYLAGDQLHALCGWGDRVMSEPEPVPVDLLRPRLARPGFQLADAAGLMLVWGQRDDSCWLQVFEARGNELQRVAELGLPGTPAGVVRAAFDPEAGALQLLWAEADREQTVLRCLRYDLAGAPPAEAEELLRLDTPLLAWQAAALAPGGSPRLQVLAGPDVRGRLFHHSLAGTCELEVPAPNVHAWALAGASEGAGPVVAHIGERIVWTLPGSGAGWETVVEDVPAVEQLRALYAGPAGYQLEWVDPERGQRLERFGG